MDQNGILEQARALGKQLSSHARVKVYRQAQQALQADEQARRLLRDYQLLAEKLQKAQAEGGKITDPDAVQMQKLQQDLATNETIKAWMRAQSDYVDLMYHLDRSIQEGLAEALGAGRPQPSRPGAARPFTPRIVPGGGKAEA